MIRLFTVIFSVAFLLVACKPAQESASQPEATAASAETHDHAADSHAGHSELPPKPATPWQTDAPLRQGMEAIAQAVAVADSAKASGKFEQAQATALAVEVQRQFDFMVVTCKLEPEADAVLHALVGKLLEASSKLESNPTDATGFDMLHKTLADYPAYFDHAGWQLHS